MEGKEKKIAYSLHGSRKTLELIGKLFATFWKFMMLGVRNSKKFNRSKCMYESG